MKRLSLAVLLVGIIVFAIQQKAETQSGSYPVIQARDNRTDTFAVAVGSPQPGETGGAVTEAELRAGSARAIKLIQHAQVVWFKKETCNSCHHQLLPQIPLNLARERGVPFDETVARETTASTFEFMKDLDAAVQRYDYIDAFFDAWSLVAAHAAGVKPNLTTSAYSQFIASRQLPDGSWTTVDDRPPQAYSAFSATAISARVVRDYLPEPLKNERETRIRRAREWLLKSQPRTNEERAFQILGLHWTGGEQSSLKKVAGQLLAEQREDGGWSELPALASDAYSTGEVLVALREGAGISTSEPAYQRGLRFLLKTQQSDGSWHVKSRLHPPAPVSPPYFETEFPYQHDQFISMMGTSWATAAFLHALPLKSGEESKRSAPLEVASAERAEWVQTALSGSAADLRKLLDAGMKPDSKTAEGTTALMLAARDIDKVKLLLERGADVNAPAATGITPLMVAAIHKGNVEVVRLMLKKGAKPNVDKGVEVRNDASALFFAVMAGDAQTAGALLDAGARLGDRMKVIGRIPITPMLYAASGGDTNIVECLVGRGADANEVDDDAISVLAWATISNHLDTVQALLKRGAQVNHVDKHGMTPLMYAASIDFGNTAVLEKLMSAGADLEAKNKDGLTALDLAKSYGHSAMVNLLAGKAASR